MFLQSVLLYGSDMWVMTGRILWEMEYMHWGVLIRIFWRREEFDRAEGK